MTDRTITLELINNFLEAISKNEEKVRNHINTNRYQSSLIKNLSTWGQICSSLDVIGDTVSAISDYIHTEYPDNQGLKYIYTYGILQTLFLQQDAIASLTEAFGYPFKRSEELIKIRDLRNAAIGHPTNQTIKGTAYHNYISRMSMHKYGFTLLRSNGTGTNEFVDVDIAKIFVEQFKEINYDIHQIATQLSEIDIMHKTLYKDNLLVDLFHSAIPYQFQKVIEGIHSSNSANVQFALSMLKGIQETYVSFKTALAVRGELEPYLEYDLNTYERALQFLETYLLGQAAESSEHDARIYFEYLQEQHKRFIKIAQEIDEEYNE